MVLICSSGANDLYLVVGKVDSTDSPEMFGRSGLSCLVRGCLLDRAHNSTAKEGKFPSVFNWWLSISKNLQLQPAHLHI